MTVGFSSIFCLFGIAFVAILALGILNQIGILNRRLTGLVALLIVVPLMCGIVLLFLLSINQMGPGMPGRPGIWP